MYIQHIEKKGQQIIKKKRQKGMCGCKLFLKMQKRKNETKSLYSH